jgi:hypothetical protein
MAHNHGRHDLPRCLGFESHLSENRRAGGILLWLLSGCSSAACGLSPTPTYVIALRATGVGDDWALSQKYLWTCASLGSQSASQPASQSAQWQSKHPACASHVSCLATPHLLQRKGTLKGQGPRAKGQREGLLLTTTTKRNRHIFNSIPTSHLFIPSSTTPEFLSSTTSPHASTPD